MRLGKAKNGKKYLKKGKGGKKKKKEAKKRNLREENETERRKPKGAKKTKRLYSAKLQVTHSYRTVL
jgi:hypothetical protein